MNIFFLIGHGGSGKSLYASSVAEYCQNSKSKTIYYDEDDKVAEVAGYNSFVELLKNENTIQPFYNQYINKLKEEAAIMNRDKVFIVSTGGFSILIDETLYEDAYKIYIKSSLADILRSVEERLVKGISFPVIKGFDSVPKNLEFKEFEIDLFKDYYHKADLFYTQKMDLLIENTHKDRELFEKNIKIITEYINNIKEENNGI